jgi:hypothetical protein
MPAPEHRAAFVAAARAFLGTPWKSKGHDAEGTDCGGLIFASGWAVESFDPDTDHHSFGHATKGKVGIWGPFPGCHRVAQQAKQEGDILIMQKSLVTSGPYYCGVLAKNEEGEFTIILQRPGKVVEEVLLEDIIHSRPLLGVIQRLNFPPVKANLSDRPTPEEADRDPEVITS